MNYLLDTHSFLWFLIGSSNLSEKAKDCILNAENHCYVSIASFWEISIKISLSKLHLEVSIHEILSQDIFPTLEIKKSHLKELSQMPFYHRDPFDRLLLSQVLVEEMTLISKDERFQEYGVPILW